MRPIATAAALAAALLAVPGAAQEIHRTRLDMVVAARCLPFSATEDAPAAVVWRAETTDTAVIHYLSAGRLHTHAVSEGSCLTPLPEAGPQCLAMRASALAIDLWADAICAGGE